MITQQCLEVNKIHVQAVDKCWDISNQLLIEGYIPTLTLLNLTLPVGPELLSLTGPKLGAFTSLKLAQLTRKFGLIKLQWVDCIFINPS